MAAKSVSDLLKDLKKKQKNKKRGAGLRAFIATQDQIEEALKQGFSQKEIWETLRAKNKMPVTYVQFTIHVKNRIEGAGKKTLFTPKGGRASGAPESQPAAETETPKDKPETSLKSCTPSAAPNTDDLI